MKRKVKCTNPLSFGLLSIDKGSIWALDSVQYNPDTKKAMIHMTEQDTIDPMWIEIPQRTLAEHFEITAP